MTTDNARLLVGTILFVHALGHGGAVAALLSLRAFPGDAVGGWLPARSWLFPTIRGSTAMMIAVGFWTAAVVGFVLASLSFWGVVLPIEVAGPAAVVGASVSVAGMIAFFGTWPAFNWLASLMMNLAIFAAQFLIGWPTQDAFVP